MKTTSANSILPGTGRSTFRLRFYFLAVFLVSAGFTHAQKSIVISETLAANGEKLPVKLGTQWMGKIWKFRFGDYAVVSSKMGWVNTSARGKLFSTKTESKSTEKFSFVLSNKTADSARVNAASNILVQSLEAIELLPHFSWGSNERVLESNNFTAFITINRDSTTTWALLMNTTTGSGAENKYEAFLSNGERKILLVPATNNAARMPAQGFEFKEDGQSLCALQYFGGGMFGFNKNIVWIDKNLDPKMKLVLAAASTAVMQLKVTAPAP